MERVFDPFIADLQAEWLADPPSGRSALARWRLLNAYRALVVQFIVCALGSLRSASLVPAPIAGAPPADAESLHLRWVRYCAPPAFASAITFGLFVLMSVLIAHQSMTVTDTPEVPIELIRTRNNPDPHSVPTPPRLPAPPTTEPLPSTAPIEVPSSGEPSRGLLGPAPTWKPTPSVSTEIRSAPPGLDDRPPTPIVRVNPVYPSRALQRGIEGWVEVEFTITAAGGVSNLRVTNSKPGSVFNRAALRAVHRWKYEPMLAAGRPTDRPGMRTRLVFELDAEDQS
jgi:protein TonB